MVVLLRSNDGRSAASHRVPVRLFRQTGIGTEYPPTANAIFFPGGTLKNFPRSFKRNAGVSAAMLGVSALLLSGCGAAPEEEVEGSS